MKRKTTPLAAGIAVLTLLLAPSGLEAESTVKACSTDTQTGAGTNLADALSAGGAIYFDCPRPSTIRLTQTYSLNRETRVWGGDAITLDGSGGFGFNVTSSAYFTHISLTGFKLQPIEYFRGVNASAFRVQRGGSLQLDHVTVTGSDTPVGSLGVLRITASSFQHDTGIAVMSAGPSSSIENTAFSANETAIFIGGGSILSSAFDTNTKGAIVVDYPSYDVEIRDSTFDHTTGNTPIAISQLGSSTSTVTVRLRRDTFRNNQGGFGAGAVAVYDPGSPALLDTGRPRRTPQLNPYYLTLPKVKFELDFDTFTDNTGQSAGAVALDLRRTGGAVVKGGQFFGNANVPVASSRVRSLKGGGAIGVSGGDLAIVESAFVRNRALYGAAVLFEATAGGSVSLGNCLVAQNAATGTIRTPVGHPAALIPGSALSLDSPAVVANSTIAKNDAVGLAFGGGAGQLTVVNSILTQNNPGNCSGVATQANHANVQFGTSDCPGISVMDPQLDSLYVPQPGGFTSTHGDPSVCRSSPVSGVDIVFQLRESPAGCSIGAFERPPVRFVKPPQGTRSP